MQINFTINIIVTDAHGVVKLNDNKPVPTATKNVADNIGKGQCQGSEPSCYRTNQICNMFNLCDIVMPYIILVWAFYVLKLCQMLPAPSGTSSCHLKVSDLLL